MTERDGQPHREPPDRAEGRRSVAPNGTADADGLAAKRQPALAGLLATPDFFPTEIDWQRNALNFIQMSRDTFARSNFLDHRIVRAGSARFSAELNELLLQCSTVQEQRPVHFILHGAFCGSTLMARHLEDLPHCFVLKEPGLLAQLARLKNGPGEPPSWTGWFEAVMALLARAYASDTAVIIKPNDVCSWMGDLLLDHDGRTKIIFLSSPLKMFLLSVLKADDRRRWVRGRIRQLAGYLAQLPFVTAIPAIEDLSDGQCGAALWLLNSFFCSSLLARSDASRIRPLNGEDLIDRPQENLREAADFFGLTSDEANRTALTTLRPLSSHAKDLRVPYDAATRATDRDDAEARFGGEVGEAIAWAERVGSGWLPGSPFPVE